MAYFQPGRPPMWFDPAPPGYPWMFLHVPTDLGRSQAADLVDLIMTAGKELMKAGEDYGALWKYNHILVLCRDYGLNERVVEARTKCAKACLKLGMYGDVYAHSCECIHIDPHADKAYYMRAECVRLSLSAAPNLGLASVPGISIADAIADYNSCYRLKQNTSALCEAVILAVNHKLVHLLPVLKDDDIQSGFSTKLLNKLISRPNAKASHMQFLVFDMRVHSTRQPFDASGIELSTLLKMSATDQAFLKRMFQLGMTVKEKDIAVAVEVFSDKDEHIMDVILSKYGDKDPHSLDQPCKEALNAKKHKLASCFKKHGAKCDDPKELVDKIKQEGNEFFKRKQYDDALGKYFRALRICREHQFNDEMALIRGNCAQACLKLELYKDAYDHADECVRLDPKLHKGYYRRAEALKLMLSSSKFDWIARVPPGKDFSSVVEDYCHCHRIKPNVDVLCEAVVMAVDHSCTDLLPALQDMELTTQLLQELLSKPETTQNHIQCIILPKGASNPQFNGTSINLSDVLKKGVTDVKVLERLFQMGMDVTEGDVQLAVECLPDTRFDILKLMVSKYDEVSIACLNRMCKLAMNAKKMKFIACFIEHGAEPPRGELKRLIGWPGKEIDLVFARYISSASQETSPKIQLKSFPSAGPEMSPKPNQPNPPPSVVPEVTSFPSTYLQERVKKRNAEGNLCFKKKDYDGALEEYTSALELCRPYGAHMREEMAILHGNTARVSLELRAYDTAFKHATAQLQFDPNSDKGFQRRAEALKRALLCPYMQPPGLTFANVVSDLCQCHQIKPNLKALSEAIILAVDYGFISVVLAPPPVVTESDVKSGFCVRLFREILSRDDVKLGHLAFLIFQLFDRITPPFNASSIKLSQLLEKSIAGMKFLRRMFELGMTSNADDIKVAVRILPDSSVSTLELIVSEQSEAKNLDLPLETAVKARKMRFIAWLIKHGTKTPDELAVFLTQALDQKDFHTAKVFLEASTTITCKNIDLGIHIAAGLTDYPELVGRLIDAGADPSGNVKKTLVEVLKLVYLPVKKQIDLVCLLLMKGADCNLLSLVRTHTTTPLHVATELALEADGDKRIIDAVVASPTFYPPLDGRIVDDRGQTPLHLAVKAQTKRDISCAILNALTGKNCINPAIKDGIKSKRAVDYLAKNDKRCTVLKAAEKKFCSPTPAQTGKGKAKKKKKKNDSKSNTQLNSHTHSAQGGPASSESQPPASDEKANTQHPQWAPATHKPQKLEYSKLSPNDKIDRQIKRIIAQGPEYFQTIVLKVDEDEPKQKPSQKETTSNQETSVVSAGPPPKIESPQDEPGDFSPAGDEIFAGFDELLWEVEVTKRVIKFFKDEKKNSKILRSSAVQTIRSLAEGSRSDKLSKQVGSEPKLQLFEAKISKASRILWQKAISFSPRQTSFQSHHIYTQVIRIWEIVVDHDQLNHYIDQIKQAHKRGSLASQCLPLSLQKGDNAVNTDPIRGRETIDLPLTFIITDSTSNDQFVPAASVKEDEYNLTSFYSFSTSLVKSVLTGENMRRDFPFKEWPKEHDIICLRNNESILLLGRSGTGKTTCCLYRLWNEFSTYWDPERRNPDTRIPRKALVSLPPPDVEEETAEDNESFDMLTEPSDTPNSVVSSSIDPPQTQMTAQAREQVTSDHPVETRVGDDHDAGSHCGKYTEASVSSFEDTQPVSEEVLEDLHPVFITKNYVLCSQMKRRFYDMMASHDFFARHMKFETEKPPNTLTGMDDHAFPLFLTAREFYILLDNSLEDGDEDKFFRRDSEGNPRGKIVSSDYDHEDPDTLLDLEESDSESEDDEQGIEATGLQPATSSKPKEKWVEVTSLYFKEIVWPSISHKCNLKGVDPLLVWMEIQSFIKGSESALRKGGPLSLEEYRNVGDKLAPNFSDYRAIIYDVYKQYQRYRQNQRHSTFLFDECDLVQDLHRRMHKVQDVPWSVHCFYIDEVQDFTQAELALFLQCCRDPNSTFFTGDTAQSIMRGISFRFQDLRSLFHRINKKVPQVKVPCKPHTLTVNFRSHSGILGLAQSILDLLYEFFPGSIDDLPEDKGMFPGPIPVLLESCDIADLAFLLSTNKREKSAIEFGAHQVILVQSKEAKDNLPSILKGAIVLTIFESKGLEFDDVLLYNFFTDSVVDEKGWRVTTTYFEGHEAAVQNVTRLPGSKDDPRGVIFNEGRHKSLNGELKYLYTAITRAKCNLWIYDSDKKRRLPVFDYWHKRGLVKVVGTEQGQGQHSLIFASISTGEQWRVQGDYFMKKHLWEQAMHCYQKAGADCAHLVKEAEAYFLIHQARHSRPEIYLRAALCFLECDQLNHDTRLLIAGAVCLMNARHVRHYANAAKLLESLGKDDRAFKAYKKAREFESCARLREKEGRFNDAVRILDQANKKREALSKAAEYERRDIQLEQELSTNELSYKYAKRYLRLKDTSGESESTLLEMLAYMNDIPRKIRFLKEGGMFEDAYDTHVKLNQHREAYHLASAQGWFDRGKSLARQQNDHKMEAQFILQQIKAEWDKPDQIHEDLHSLIKSKDHRIKTFAYLLLGKFEKDTGFCRMARTNFQRNKVGEFETFHVISQIEEGTETKSSSVQSVLRACHAAQDVGRMLKLDPDEYPSAKQVQQHAAEFYGLQKVGDVYYMAPHQDFWIGTLLEQCVCEDRKTDSDGMLRLSVRNTREEISKHCNSLVSKWVQVYQLQQKLEEKLKSFKLHKEISENRFLSRSFSTAEVPPGTLKDYIQNCIHFFELSQLDSGVPYMDKTLWLLLVFSPQISIYLPLSKMHIKPVRESKAAKAAIQGWINRTIQRQDSEAERLRIDLWLNSWRACCIAGGDIRILLNALLEEHAKKVNENSKTPGFKRPPGFVFWRNEKRYYHLFFFWLRSCDLIREGDVLLASKCIVYHFLSNIAEVRGAIISVMNFVDVLSVNCTALLAMLAQLDSPYYQYQVPMLYKHAVQIFDDLNASSSEEWLFTACAKEVRRKARTRYGTTQLRSECIKMLWRALDILLGHYRREFSVLSFAMKQDRALISGASHHCLVLALTLFGNLTMMRSRPPKPIHEYQKRFSYILEKAMNSPEGSQYMYIEDAMNTFGSHLPNLTMEVFSLLHRLLLEGDPNAVVVNLVPLQNGIVGFMKPTQPQMKSLQPKSPTSSGVSYASAAAHVDSGDLPPQGNMFGSAIGTEFFPSGMSVPSHPFNTVLVGQPISPGGYQSQHEAGHPGIDPGFQPQFQVGAPTPPGFPPYDIQPQLQAGTPANYLGIHVATQPSVAETPPIGGTLENENVKSGNAASQKNASETAKEDRSSGLARHEEPLKEDRSSGLARHEEPLKEDRSSGLARHKEPLKEDRSSGLARHEEPLASQPEPDEHDISYDAEEELSHDLVGAVEVAQDEPHESSETVDSSIIDKSFCSVCAAALIPEAPVDHEDSTDTPLVDDSVETYEFHVTSDVHKRNIKVHEKFNNDLEFYYLPLDQELSQMLQDCQSVLEKYHSVGMESSLLERIIDDLTHERENNEIKLSGVKESATWQDGIQIINEMSDRMQALLSRNKPLYEKIEKNLPAKVSTAMAAEDNEKQDSDHEGELEELKRFEEEGEEELPKEARTLEDKELSRQKKKERRNRKYK